jgi:hypothetical protein
MDNEFFDPSEIAEPISSPHRRNLVAAFFRLVPQPLPQNKPRPGNSQARLSAISCAGPFSPNGRTARGNVNYDPFVSSGRSRLTGAAAFGAPTVVASLKIRQQADHASMAMLSRQMRDGEIFFGNVAGAMP